MNSGNSFIQLVHHLVQIQLYSIPMNKMWIDANLFAFSESVILCDFEASPSYQVYHEIGTIQTKFEMFKNSLKKKSK